MNDLTDSERPARSLTAADVLRIALTPDPEVRNHCVILTYWEMSRVIDAAIHDKLDVKLDKKIERNKEIPQRPSNANWFTMATWAVSTVGHNIRSDQLPRRVNELLPSGLRAQATPWLLSMRSRSGRRVQRSLDYGQMVVFFSTMLAALDFLDKHEEKAIDNLRKAVKKQPNGGADVDLTQIQGPLNRAKKTRPRVVAAIDNEIRNNDLRNTVPNDESFATTVPRRVFDEGLEKRNTLLPDEQFLARQLVEQGYVRQMRATIKTKDFEAIEKMLSGAAPFESTKILEALADLLINTSKTVPDLRAAFAAYRRASQSTDTTEIAQEVFRGNLIIAAVEQVLLDGPVTTVVEHVPREFEDWLENSASVWGERTVGIPRALGRLGVSRRLHRTQETIRESWARMLTDQILVVALPTETLRIGRDIPLRSWDGEFAPAELACLDWRPVLNPVPGSQADTLSTSQLFKLFDRSRGDGVRTGAWDWRRFDERLNFAANLMLSRHSDPTLFWQPYSAEDRARIHNGRVPIRSSGAFEPFAISPPDLTLEDQS